MQEPCSKSSHLNLYLKPQISAHRWRNKLYSNKQMSYQETWAWGIKFLRMQVSEEEVTCNEARPRGDSSHSVPACWELFTSLSYCSSASYWACIIAVTVKAHHFRLLSAWEFPTLPSVCLLSINRGQVGISHDAVESAFMCVWEKREWEMDADCQKNLPWIPWNWAKSFLGFPLCTWLISQFGPVFVGALRSPQESLNHRSTFNTVTTISLWFRVLHKYLLGLVHLSSYLDLLKHGDW